MASAPGPWSAKARREKNTDEAHVWGHDDPPLAEPDALERKMATFLSSFPASHWRPRVGAVIKMSYPRFPQLDKQAGIMVTEPGGVKFNIILNMDDPVANIEVMHARLRNHFMLAIGSSGNEITHNSGEGTGDHGFQWIFRTAKLRTFKMGLAKHGDLTHSKAETGIRHAWIAMHGWSNPTEEEKQEMANFLCHLIGFQPPYPNSFGGALPTPAIGGFRLEASQRPGKFQKRSHHARRRAKIWLPIYVMRVGPPSPRQPAPPEQAALPPPAPPLPEVKLLEVKSEDDSDEQPYRKVPALPFKRTMPYLKIVRRCASAPPVV